MPKKNALDKIADALLLFSEDKEFRRDLGSGLLGLTLLGFAAFRWLDTSQVAETVGFVAAIAFIAVAFVAVIFVFGWAVRKGWDRAGRKK